MFGVMRGSTWSPESMSSLAGLVEAQVPRRVARRPDGGQVPTGNLRARPVLEEHVGDDRVDQRQDRHGGVAQRFELLGRRAHPAQRTRHPVQQVLGLVVAVVDQLGVGGVQGDPGARGLADPAGQPVVVRVDVGDHDALHVGDVAAGLLHAALQRAEGVVGVPAGVDEVGPTVGLEEVDQHVAQRVVRQRHRNAPQSGPDLLDTGEGVVGRGRAPGALRVRVAGPGACGATSTSRLAPRLPGEARVHARR